MPCFPPAGVHTAALHARRCAPGWEGTPGPGPASPRLTPSLPPAFPTPLRAAYFCPNTLAGGFGMMEYRQISAAQELWSTGGLIKATRILSWSPIPQW